MLKQAYCLDKGVLEHGMTGHDCIVNHCHIYNYINAALMFYGSFSSITLILLFTE